MDNAKCAIVTACRHDPLVQRAYGECAEGYGFKVDACPPTGSAEEGVGFMMHLVQLVEQE